VVCSFIQVLVSALFHVGFHFVAPNGDCAFGDICLYQSAEYRGADKSLARPTSRCILFDGENITFDASLVIYIYMYSTNIPPIIIMNRIYETQNLLSL
jgi:hypothetical protein